MCIQQIYSAIQQVDTKQLLKTLSGLNAIYCTDQNCSWMLRNRLMQIFDDTDSSDIKKIIVKAASIVIAAANLTNSYRGNMMMMQQGLAAGGMGMSPMMGGGMNPMMGGMNMMGGMPGMGMSPMGMGMPGMGMNPMGGMFGY